jgi:hypothetical protein
MKKIETHPIISIKAVANLVGNPFFIAKISSQIALDLNTSFSSLKCNTLFADN